jgi:hypothetical protein
MLNWVMQHDNGDNTSIPQAGGQGSNRAVHASYNMALHGNWHNSKLQFLMPSIQAPPGQYHCSSCCTWKQDAGLHSTCMLAGRVHTITQPHTSTTPRAGFHICVFGFTPAAQTEKRKERRGRVLNLGAFGAQVCAAWRTFDLVPSAPTQKLHFSFS